MNKLLRIVTGVLCELLTLDDPYDKYFHPRVTGSYSDGCGRRVLQVHAKNYRDVGRITEGLTIGGEVHTHVGYEQWEIHSGDGG